MILYRIEDFKSNPSWIEYISLYAICSIFVVIGAYSVMGRLSSTVGIIALLLFLIASYIFATIKRVRQERAIQFYCACLKELDEKALHNLAQRYRRSDLELTIIQQRLKALNTQSTPPDLSTSTVSGV